MAALTHVGETGIETPFVTSSPVIGWRAHYAGGQVFTSHSHSWLEIPATGLILLTLIERDQFVPGKHFRTAIQAEWYGFTAIEDVYIVDWQGLSLTEVQLRWPLVVAWKSGQLVSDAEMEAAFDADSAEWAI